MKQKYIILAICGKSGSGKDTTLNRLLDIKNILGNDFVKQIGQNMMLINKIIDLAISYSEKDN